MSATLSTHVLDTARGAPAVGVAVSVHRVDGAARTTVGTGITDADGRTSTLDGLREGTYALVFDVAAYFARDGVASLYDEITIRFRVDGTSTHYHVPLLLSPFGYTTYRGS